MSSPIVVGVVCAIVAMIGMYLEARLFDNPKDKVTYAKNMVLVGSISASIVHFMGSPDIIKAGSILAASAAPAVSSTFNGEQMLRGFPKF